MDKKLTPEQFQQLIHQHELILRGASGGKRIYLEGYNLKGLKVFHGSFKLAVFHNCKLDECHFTDTSFERAELIGCSVVGARFKRCNMRQANLKDSNFSEAHFEQTNIFDAYYNAAKLKGIFLDGEEITL